MRAASGRRRGDEGEDTKGKIKLRRDEKRDEDKDGTQMKRRRRGEEPEHASPPPTWLGPGKLSAAIA